MKAYSLKDWDELKVFNNTKQSRTVKKIDRQFKKIQRRIAKNEIIIILNS
jgi:hypothetical protein